MTIPFADLSISSLIVNLSNKLVKKKKKRTHLFKKDLLIYFESTYVCVGMHVGGGAEAEAEKLK